MRSEESKKKQLEYIKRYQEETYRDIHFKLRKDVDKELVEYLENLPKEDAENISALVVRLLREHLAKVKGN